MSECKKRSCKNKAVEGKKMCKYHQSKKEEVFKKVTGTSVGILLSGVAIIKKFK